MNKMTRKELSEFLNKDQTEHAPTRFEDVQFVGEDLRDIAFMDCDFVNCSFIRCDLSGSNFSHCLFTKVTMECCNLDQVNFAWSHFSQFFFEMCHMIDTVCCYAVFKHGGFSDCRMCNVSMVNSYHFDTSVTRGQLQFVDFQYSTVIDVNYINTAFERVNYDDVAVSHHITMDDVSLKDTNIDPFGDEVTVYGTFDDDCSDEIAVHLVVNTKNGNATVTSAEKV